MNKKMSDRILSGALVVAAAVAVVAPAEAALYRGRFDPVYGTPFTDTNGSTLPNPPSLAWAGTLEVTVDDSCVNPGTLFLVSCLGGTGFLINKATVELFNVGDALTPEGFPVTPRQVMDFGAASGGGLSGLNWQLSFDANENLTGVRSTAFNAIQGAIDATIYDAMTGGTSQAWFSLQFLGDYAQLYWFDKEPVTGWTGIPDEVLLTAGVSVGWLSIGGICRNNDPVTIPGWVPVNPDRCGWSDPDNISRGAFINFERVPEPATYALVPAALALMGAAGVINRRRRSAEQKA